MFYRYSIVHVLPKTPNLPQAMQEVSIESRVPNPDDELEARLARLRGEESRAAPPAGAVALPPAAHSFGRSDVPFDDDLDDMSMDEVWCSAYLFLILMIRMESNITYSVM